MEHISVVQKGNLEKHKMSTRTRANAKKKTSKLKHKYDKDQFIRRDVIATQVGHSLVYAV